MPEPASTSLADVIASLRRASDPSEPASSLAERLVPGRLGPEDRLLGLGWATVDTDRTLADAHADLEATGGLPGWAPATREPAVGATARVAWIGDIAIVVLEPDTEARLAASLARFGEGLCLVYVLGGGPGGMTRPTALGRSGRLRPHRHPWGPYVIAVIDSPEALPFRAGMGSSMSTHG